MEGTEIMQELYHTICDPVGIHVRPAGGFVKKALQFESEIFLYCNGQRADGKKLFSILSMEAETGDEMRICIEGSDEAGAARCLRTYLNGSL